jgi:hypothetical protein
MISSFASPELDRREFYPSLEIGLCSNCERFIYGEDFIEPRNGTVICTQCIAGGAGRSQGTNWRLIEEARVARRGA